MAKKEETPKFINAQSFPVTIHGEDRRQFVVDPYSEEGRKPTAVYVVEGEFYRQFVSAKGPLAPFPKEETVGEPPPPPPKPEPAPAAPPPESNKSAPADGPDAAAVKTAEVKPPEGNLKDKAKAGKK